MSEWSRELEEYSAAIKTARIAIVKKYIVMRDLMCQFKVIKPPAKRFRKITDSIRDIIIDILRQSASRGSVDVTSICASHSLSLETFQKVFV